MPQDKTSLGKDKVGAAPRHEWVAGGTQSSYAAALRAQSLYLGETAIKLSAVDRLICK